MKKMLLLLILTSCVGLIIITNNENVSAYTFSEAYAGQVCIYVTDFTNSSTNIADDDDFGTSYLVANQLLDTVEVVTERNWLGIAIETTELDVYRVLTYEYPILLDTFGETVITDSGVTELDYSQRNFEQLANGESVLITNTFSVSRSATKFYRTEWGISFAREANAGISIPVNGVEVGVSLNSSLYNYVNGSYEYTNTYVTSTSKSYNVSVSNTSNQTYYQDGKILYLEWGTRFVFILKVIIVLELNYTLNEYTTGSWFSKVYHYDYTLASSTGYNTLYKDFEFLSAYSRYANPFLYTFDTVNHSYDLIDLQREANRLYVG